MSYVDDTNPYRYTGEIAAAALPAERVDFIKKTYLHLAGAVFAFAALEAVLLNAPFTQDLVSLMVGGRYNFLIVLGLFMFVGWIARSWAQSSASQLMQYLGLALYVAAQAVIFVPLLYIAREYGGPEVIPSAALVTLVLFGGLSIGVLFTRHDFSYLRTALWIGGLAAMGLALCSVFIGFSLGMIFTVAMCVLACGYILYDTSNVLHHYRIGQHVAASLALFASVAMLFYQIVRLMMSLNSRN